MLGLQLSRSAAEKAREDAMGAEELASEHQSKFIFIIMIIKILRLLKIRIRIKILISQ